MVKQRKIVCSLTLVYFNELLSSSQDVLRHLSHVEDHATAVEGTRPFHQYPQLKRTHIPSHQTKAFRFFTTNR